MQTLLLTLSLSWLQTGVAPELATFRKEFISITPGKGKYPLSFVMGSKDGSANQRPTHTVTFDYNFAIAKYEVTQNLWAAVMGGNPSKWKGPRNSVEMISFDEAQRFCEKATRLMRDTGLIEPRQEIRLPTEAEWEYVARAGTKTTYSFAPKEMLDHYAWHTGNAAGNDPPVGAKKPNPWGLYDVHGYLWEWCLDHAHLNYDGAPGDGRAWVDGGEVERRILRGGSWKDDASRLTSGYRRRAARQLRDDAIGFRCVLAEVP